MSDRFSNNSNFYNNNSNNCFKNNKDKNKKYNKKGYFFLMDGLIAIGVLVTGFIIIGSIFVGEPVFKPPYGIGDDILRMLSTTNISGIDLNRNPGIKTLFDNDIITDNSTKILQQVGKFYYSYCQGNNDYLSYMNTTVFEIVDNIIPHPYYAEMNISGYNGFSGCSIERVYTNVRPDTTSYILSSQERSKMLMVTQKIVFGNYDVDTLFGPYIITLKVWR